jgi:indole-3-glycerol phosphate synthase
MSLDSQAGIEGVLRAGGVLDRIVASKKGRLDRAKKEVPIERLVSRAETRASGTRGVDFFEAITRKESVNIIAEIKRRSPSKGIIREQFDPASIASSYERAGAAALSVLTEEDHFDGSLDHLIEAGRAAGLPLLRKDFLFDPYQVYEAASAGASAILLIVAILDDDLLARLSKTARGLGLASLVEVHTDREMERAIAAGAEIIGINNRDLTSFDVDLNTSLRLRQAAPPGIALVSESGIRTWVDISMLRSAGFDAFLVGEHLMASRDPGEALKGLVQNRA